MPRKGRSNEEIVDALQEVEGGEKVAEVCRRLWSERSRRFPAGGRRPAVWGCKSFGELRAVRYEQQAEAGRGGHAARSAHPAGDRPERVVSLVHGAPWRGMAADGLPTEPTPGGEADSGAHRHATVSDARSSRRVAAEGAGGRPCAPWLSGSDGPPKTGRLGGSVPSGSIGRMGRKALTWGLSHERAGQPDPRAAAGGHASE